MTLVTNKYNDVKDVITETVNGSSDWAKAKGKTLLKAEGDLAKNVKNASYTLNELAHKNPWRFIGGAAISGLVFGLLMRGLRYSK